MQPPKQDRVFDGLSQRFQSHIYDDPRGIIRLAILQDDLSPLVKTTHEKPLRILDAGGGLGQMAIWLAQQGHDIVLAEPSGEMLQQATASINSAGLTHSITLLQASVQELEKHDLPAFDMIMFHAVLEWLAEPRQGLKQLLAHLKPGGWLSLMFFNEHSSVMRRLLVGELGAVQQGAIASDGQRGLAPISPLIPETVLGWLPELGLELHTWSGVRCFYDYIYPKMRKQADMAAVIPLEREYSRQEPWRSLARYQHMLCRKV